MLTRLPTPYRSSPQLVHAYLVRAFGDRTLPIGDASIVALLGELAALGIAGGAAYDALIAFTPILNSCGSNSSVFRLVGSSIA